LGCTHDPPQVPGFGVPLFRRYEVNPSTFNPAEFVDAL
jgi:hypothetical protein